MRLPAVIEELVGRAGDGQLAIRTGVTGPSGIIVRALSPRSPAPSGAPMESSDSAALLAAVHAVSQQLATLRSDLAQDIADFRAEARGRFDHMDTRLEGIERGVLRLGEI
jgi:hypothetical protein